MCTQNPGQDFVQDFGRNFMAHAATGDVKYYGADVAGVWTQFYGPRSNRPGFWTQFYGHAATGDGKYYGADVALLEFGRRWEYLEKRKKKKIVTDREEKRGAEGSGKEGQRAGGQASQAKCEYYICDTEHTHTHTHTQCFQNIVFSVPLSRTLSLLILSLYVFMYAYITHRRTHTRSLFMSLTRLYMCARERE